jgi:hypothetical protein
VAPIMGIIGVIVLNKPWAWFVCVGAGALTVAVISNTMRAQYLKKHPLEGDEGSKVPATTPEAYSGVSNVGG